MSISRRTIRKIIQEAMPRGGVPDMVGTATGVHGEKQRRRLDPNLAIKDYKEWARDYMGAASGPNSSSVLATYIVDQELSEAEWMEIALGMGFTPRDVGLEVVRQQKEYDAGDPLHESARAGELMLIWNELQVGDLIDVDADYNSYPKVRIIQKVDDVALESGLPPGPGFIGKEANGDEIVFSVDEVDPTSYEKYTLAERKEMRVTKRQLRRIIKEEKAKLLKEYASAPTTRDLIADVTDIIHSLGDIVEVTSSGNMESPDMGGLNLELQEEVADFIGDAIVNLNRALSTLAKPSGRA